MAWLALVPLLAALGGAAGRVAPAPCRALRLGLVTGLVYFGGTVYWTADVMVTFGGLSRPVAVGVSALLVGYLALFVALFAWLVARAVARYGLQGLWAAPCAWVAVEFLRAHLFTGFPWVPLGNSQVSVSWLAQIASVFGVYGLSALVCLVSTAGVIAWLAPGRRRGVVAGVGAVLLLVSGWGAWRVADRRLTREGEPLAVGIVQGNVPQEQKWDPAYGRDILQTYVGLTREVASRGARLIVWPESATPFFFEEEPAGNAVIRALARETATTLIFGSDEVERASPPRFYNSAFLIGPDGSTGGRHRKSHLVPFGEYVPLRRILFFVAPLVDSVADFTAGEGFTMLPVDGHPVSVAICYEAVFPHLGRNAVRAGSRLLVTVTNDAWYGWSSAAWQHFDQAAMRAIEQGRYLVRAANTGVSGIVDPYGRVVAATGLFETTTVRGDVRLLAGGTLYATIGDSFAWAAAAMAVWMAFAPGRGRRGEETDRGRDS